METYTHTSRQAQLDNYYNSVTEERYYSCDTCGSHFEYEDVDVSGSTRYADGTTNIECSDCDGHLVLMDGEE